MRARIWAAVTIALALTALVGCANPGGPILQKEGEVVSTPNDSTTLYEGDRKSVYEVPLTLTDGREVVCLVFDGYREGGLHCFEAAPE